MSHSRQIVPLSQAKAPFFAGVDVGGTNIKIGLVDDEGNPLAHTSMPTEEEQGPEQAVSRASETLRKTVAEIGLDYKEIARVGLGTPGTMDVARGVLLEPGNLPHWWHFPIQSALSMSLQERRERHSAMLQVLKRNDIATWTRRFVEALEQAQQPPDNARMRLVSH